MSQMHHEFAAAPAPLAVRTGTGDAARLALRCRAVAEVGAVLEQLADTRDDAGHAAFAEVPARAAAAGEAVLAAALVAVEDIAAVLDPGSRALLTLAAAGCDTRVPARALWADFAASRQAVRALCEER